MLNKTVDFSKKDLLFLAPLAGFTDLPFRSVIKKFGVDVTYSEMISANALSFHSQKTLKMVEKSPLETPYIVQIAANSPNVAKSAVEILNDIEGIDGIDLNCGCPVKKVVNQGSGSELLNDLSKMGKIIQTIKKTSNKQYTSVKVRLGFNDKIPDKIAKICEDNGADFIAVHGRTRAGGYKATVDYEAIAKAKQSVNIPVVANGDITSFEIAKNVKETTNCDGLMIGRGAIGNPWIFYQLKNNMQTVNQELKQQIILEHFDKMLDFHGTRAIGMFRKHLHTYSKGIQGATNFRNIINHMTDPEELKEVIVKFFSPNQ
jgi:tRNA-dihydrouridine synthase B